MQLIFFVKKTVSDIYFQVEKSGVLEDTCEGGKVDTHREVLRVIVAHLEEALRAGAGVLRALQVQQSLMTLYRSGRALECSGPCKYNSHLRHYTAPGGRWSAPGPANITAAYDTIPLRAGAGVLRALLTQQPLTTLYRSARALECSGPC